GPRDGHPHCCQTRWSGGSTPRRVSDMKPLGLPERLRWWRGLEGTEIRPAVSYSHHGRPPSRPSNLLAKTLDGRVKPAHGECYSNLQAARKLASAEGIQGPNSGPLSPILAMAGLRAGHPTSGKDLGWAGRAR